MEQLKNFNELFSETDLTNPKYQNAKIYKLSFPNSDKVYIGSSIQSLKTRYAKHRNSYTKWIRGDLEVTGNKPRFFSYFPILIKNNDNNYDIQLVKNFPCNNRYELELEEYRLVTETEHSINKQKIIKAKPLVKCLRCNVVLTKSGFKQHYKTKRCLKFENTN